MRIWLVNPFDPLPGEKEQLGRYAYLARCLRDGGHDVTWWSSRFSHRFKRNVDAELVNRAAEEWRIRVRLLDAPPYGGNVSFSRLRNHRILAQQFDAAARNETPPDLILASAPPLELAAAATRIAAAARIPSVIDIQDQWPDNFARVLPRFAKPLRGLLLAPYYAIERTAYQSASAIIGVAEGYVERGITVGGAKRWSGSFPLGVDLADVDAAMTRGRARYADRWVKPADQTWLLYSGSLSHAYDFMTVVRAAIPAQREFGERVRFLISGTGELADEAARLVQAEGLRQVTIAGFLEFDEYAALLAQADIGFNASFPDALIYLPNKIFYYLAAGAAVLNTIPGECARLVAEHQCGLTYSAGDVDGCYAAIRTLLSNGARRKAMGAAARRLVETQLDRKIIYARLVEFLERVGTEF